jgi:hypothetical protein
MNYERRQEQNVPHVPEFCCGAHQQLEHQVRGARIKALPVLFVSAFVSQSAPYHPNCRTKR